MSVGDRNSQPHPSPSDRKGASSSSPHVVDQRPRWNSSVTASSHQRQTTPLKGVNTNGSGRGTYRSREERLEEIRKRQEIERERRLKEIWAMEERERQLRAQKEAERLRHIREMKTREEQRLRAAEERRRALERAAEERRAATLAKFNDHLNRLSEQNRSNKPIYAFGSSTPRSLSYLQKLATQDRVYNTTLKSPAEKPSVVVEATTKVPQPQPKGAIMSRSVQFAKRASGVTPLTNPSIESRMAKSLVTETPPLRKRPLISQSVSPSGRGGRILPKASELLNKRRSAPPAGVSQNSTAVRKRMIRTESYTKLSPTTESLFVGPQTSTLENVEVPSTVNISSVAETVLAINDSDGAVPMIKLEENSNLIESLPDETDQVGLVNVSPCILRPESDGLVSLSSSDETLDGIQEISIEELSENDANDFSVVQSTPDNEIISQGMEESHERLDSNPFLILIPTAEVEEKKLPLVPSGSPKSYHFVEPPRSTTASLNEALAAAPRSNGLSKTLTEEEAKAALAERRRIAREEMEKQKELERMREEEEQRQAELQKRREEEEFRRAEQEALELLELRNQEENARLQRAMEEAQKLKEEEERRVEAERSKQEEIERRTAEAEKKVEAERLEREEKIRREEEERIERKKRLEAVMSRTRKSAGGTSDLKPAEKSGAVLSPEDSKAPTIPLSHSGGILAKIMSERPEMQKSLNILSRVRSSPNTEAPKSEDIMTKSLVSPATREVAADTTDRSSASIGFDLGESDPFESSPWENDVIPDTAQVGWDQFDSAFAGGITSLGLTNGNSNSHQYDGTWGVAVMPVNHASDSSIGFLLDDSGSRRHNDEFREDPNQLSRFQNPTPLLPGVVPTEFPDLIPKLRPTIGTHDSGIEVDYGRIESNIHTEKLLDL